MKYHLKYKNILITEEQIYRKFDIVDIAPVDNAGLMFPLPDFMLE